jgi:hypothetical protein
MVEALFEYIRKFHLSQRAPEMISTAYTDLGLEKMTLSKYNTRHTPEKREIVNRWLIDIFAALLPIFYLRFEIADDIHSASLKAFEAIRKAENSLIAGHLLDETFGVVVGRKRCTS